MAKRSSEYLEEFSARLRAAMAARGLSQADLARLLVRVPSEARKVSSAVSRWCKAEADQALHEAFQKARA